jgi:hypothetical protein
MCFDLVAAQLFERAVTLKPCCIVCGFEWDAGGLSDPLWGGSAYVADTGLQVPRALLLSCPECAEDAKCEVDQTVKE